MMPYTHLYMKFYVCMIVTAIVATVGCCRVACADVQGPYTYTITNAQATITGFDETYSGFLEITNSLGGHPVTALGDSAFNLRTNLTSITIPGTVTRIGEYTFANCFGLSGFAIPSNVTNIDVTAFRSCHGLVSIDVDDANPSYSSIDGVLFDKNQAVLIEYPEKKAAEDYSIPDSVTNILEYAFFQSQNITSITIPASTTAILANSFGACPNLTNVVIGSSVRTIGERSFSTCRKLNSVFIPESVMRIGEYAFRACSALTNVMFAASSLKIEDFAFEDCTSLSHVLLPDGLLSMGLGVFYRCDSLCSVTVPSSLTNVASYLFYECPSLNSVLFRGVAPTHDTSVFRSSSPTTVYYLPGMAGWGDTFAGQPTVLWNPDITGLMVSTSGVLFTVTGTTNIPIRVEVCSDLVAGDWALMETTNLGGGVVDVRDTGSTNYPERYYRISGP